jgi:hypothetical protein
MRGRGAAALAATGILLASGVASADGPWVERGITLPQGEWAFDVGLGVGHAPGNASAGINGEVAYAITGRIEIGVRTGLRMSDDPGRAIEPDLYGRLFDRQYFDGDGSVLANPELRVRGALIRGPVELGLEGRFVIPLETNEAGLEAGLPLAVHLGDQVRLDTGVWLPILIGDAAPVGLSVPLDLWIQASPRLWLGPMTGISVFHLGDPAATTSVSMGFGLGYQIRRNLDFKAMFLFRDINVQAADYGLGAGVQIRIE